MKYKLIIEADSIEDLLNHLPMGSHPPAPGDARKFINNEGQHVKVRATDELDGEIPTFSVEAGPSFPGELPQPTSDEDDTPNANPPQTDVLGMPWDERIHASTKATNKDGSWRYKRGVDKDLIETVEAELKSPAPAPMPLPPGSKGDVEPLQIPDFLQRAKADAAPAPAVTNVTYEQVIAALTGALQSNPPKLTADGLPALYAMFGVADIAALRENQDAMNKLHAHVSGL